MDQLTKLAVKYKTDKWGKHHYTPVYYDLFKDRRETVKNVIEIGVAEGAGLFMWREFFPNATIYGAEFDKQRVDFLMGEERDRITVFKCDQSKEKDLIDLIDNTDTDIDLVIDDGSHKSEDQIFTCKTLMRLLNKKVVYIIEDVADPNIIEQLGHFNCQVLKVGKRYDDRLVIVTHPNG